MNYPCFSAALTIALFLLGPTQGFADALSDANRLLRITETGQKFEARAKQQAHDIILSYDRIVNLSANVGLPAEIRQSIAECYTRAYDWENFETGFARILATTLSERQILLLIGFYRGQSIPPYEIETFKDTIGLADRISQAAMEYMYRHGQSCVVQDTQTILTFLRQHPDAALPAASDPD